MLVLNGLHALIPGIPRDILGVVLFAPWFLLFAVIIGLVVVPYVLGLLHIELIVKGNR